MCGVENSFNLKAELGSSSIVSESLDYYLDSTCNWPIVATKLAFKSGAAISIKIDTLS
jgi:hypothetical protein